MKGVRRKVVDIKSAVGGRAWLAAKHLYVVRLGRNGGPAQAWEFPFPVQHKHERCESGADGYVCEVTWMYQQ